MVGLVRECPGANTAVCLAVPIRGRAGCSSGLDGTKSPWHWGTFTLGINMPTETGYYWVSWQGSHTRTIAFYNAASSVVRVIGASEKYGVEDFHEWVRIPNEQALAYG